MTAKEFPDDNILMFSRLELLGTTHPTQIITLEF